MGARLYINHVLTLLHFLYLVVGFLAEIRSGAAMFTAKHTNFKIQISLSLSSSPSIYSSREWTNKQRTLCVVLGESSRKLKALLNHPHHHSENSVSSPHFQRITATRCSISEWKNKMRKETLQSSELNRKSMEKKTQTSQTEVELTQICRERCSENHNWNKKIVNFHK